VTQLAGKRLGEGNFPDQALFEQALEKPPVTGAGLGMQARKGLGLDQASAMHGLSEFGIRARPGLAS